MEEDTWTVITSYFDQFPNWIAQHQIDSYNDFINNKIPLVFKNKNKRTAFIFDKEDPEVSYEITLYLGGKSSNLYKICTPSIIDHATGKMRPMFPNEARLKNLTYALDVFYDIEVEVTIRKGDNILHDKLPLPDAGFLKNNYLGKIPIMLKSNMCILNKIPSKALPEIGESEFEYGGYFIIDGREKIIMSNESKATNILFLSKINDTKFNYSHVCEVKAISDEAFEHARTNKIMLENEGTITLRIGQERAFISDKHVIDGRVERRDVPIFIMFRLLGIESDEQIIKMIAGDLKTELGTKLAELLRPCAQDRYIHKFGIYSKQMAENYLEPLTSRSQVNISGSKLSEIQKDKINRLSFLYNTIREDFLPHVGSDHYSKACYLAYMTRKLLLFQLGLETETDRDSFMNKRIDMSGFMLATLFKDSFQQVAYSAIREIKRKYEFEGKEFSGEKFVYLINENTYKEIFKVGVFDTEFSGALKKGSIGNKPGVVQQIDRINYFSALSHIRRVTDPVTGGRPQDDQRRINVTQYGYLCPCESPEGQSIGLRKALSVMTTVTIGYPSGQLKELCYKLSCKPIKSIPYDRLYEGTRVFINGNWIGNVANPNLMVTLFRLMRRNGLVNAFTSIAWYPEREEILIFSDNGRVTRPLYIVDNGELVIRGQDIKDLASGKRMFTDLCFSRLKRRDNKATQLTDFMITGVDVLGLQFNDLELDMRLRENQGAIEYVDVQESDTRMLTQDFGLKALSGTRITHVELHPTMILGALAQISTRIDAGSSGKYLGAGASKHPKQSVAVYASNFPHRIDTSAHLLHNAERAIIRGRLTDIVHHDKMGTGVNICVALAYYNGYNQEDAILGNSTSIDLGLFNSSYYKMYEALELVNKKSGQEERFYNPLYTSEVKEYPESLVVKKGGDRFENLDKYGFIKEGTYLTGNEILIGKYMKSSDEHGQDDFADISVSLKPDNKNSYVDKVFTCSTNLNGDRLCKVRTCQFRKPEIGDKFSSRNGQKGTFGLLIPREDMPFTDDGIVPDMIMHPSAYPKRMTLNQLLELLLGELAVELGMLGLAGSMEDFESEKINEILTDVLGLSYYGDRVMYNGVYGEQMPVAIFMGPLYVQRLKYMVADKINKREPGHRVDGVPVPGGAYTVRERQVVSGRANGGGIKMGEMERDALISHGVFSFLNERDMVKGDKFIVYVSTATGEISIANPEKNIFYDAQADGPLSYHLHEGSAHGNEYIVGLNTVNKQQRKFVRIHIPYAMKLLIHEMQGMGMTCRLHPKKLQMVIEAASNSQEHIDETMLELDDIISQSNAEIADLLTESLDTTPEPTESNLAQNPILERPSISFKSESEVHPSQIVRLDNLPGFNPPTPAASEPVLTAPFESQPQIPVQTTSLPEMNGGAAMSNPPAEKRVSFDIQPSIPTNSITASELMSPADSEFGITPISKVGSQSPPVSNLPATDSSQSQTAESSQLQQQSPSIQAEVQVAEAAQMMPVQQSGGMSSLHQSGGMSHSLDPVQQSEVKTVSILANPLELSSMGIS